MKQSRYTDEQIIAVPQGSRGQHEGPAPVPQAGISDVTIYKWRSKDWAWRPRKSDA